MREFVRRGDRVVAALSGGVDSVFLLHLLRRLQGGQGFLLSAIHVHHGLSPNADSWQACCQSLCDGWGIPLQVKRVSVEPGSAEGPEAAARRARYHAFAVLDAEWLLMAHQREDQAETLVFNLLRGAGVAGAGAIPLVREFPGRPSLGILRPLLDVPRERIVAAARSEGLTWIEDESNEDERYTRNFLRLRVFPLLRERFPGCEGVLARAAGHFAESDGLLDQLAQIDARTAMRDGRIVAAELARLGDARARNLMRYVLKSEGVLPPDAARLQEIVRQVCHAAPDRQVSFALRGRELHRFRGEVWFVAHCAPGGVVPWQGEAAVAWGGSAVSAGLTFGCGVSCERLARAPVRIAPRSGGEHLQPDARRPRRALKKLLQEHDVPPWRRSAMPLLWCGEDLVWVPGLGIDCAYQCAPGEPGWTLAWDATS